MSRDSAIHLSLLNSREVEIDIPVLSSLLWVVLQISNFRGVVEVEEDRQSLPLVAEGEAAVEVEDQALCLCADGKLCLKGGVPICRAQTVFQTGQFTGDKVGTETGSRMRIGQSIDAVGDSKRRWKIHKKTKSVGAQ